MDGGEATRRWARKRGIEEQRLYEISKLRRQFRELLEDAELIEKKSLDEIAGGVQGSAERRIRAGEMRKLRDLKRKARYCMCYCMTRVWGLVTGGVQLRFVIGVTVGCGVSRLQTRGEETEGVETRSALRFDYGRGGGSRRCGR